MTCLKYSFYMSKYTKQLKSTEIGQYVLGTSKLWSEFFSDLIEVKIIKLISPHYGKCGVTRKRTPWIFLK